MNFFLRCIFCAAAILVAELATAAESLGRTVHINRVFSEGSASGGFYTREPMPECKWGIMYLNLSTDSGKAMFSLALTAKTADQPVVRIDYLTDEQGKCRVVGLHTM